jgi:protein subunit release factor A
MARVTPTEAIRLSGRSKASFYKDVKSGKVSSTQDETGKTVFETSELARVYGQLKTKKTEFVSATELVETRQDAEKLRSMAQEIAHLRALLDSKESHIKTLQDTMKLLEYRASQPVQNETAQDKTGFFFRLFGR